MDLALRDLKRHQGRFLATVVGVGLLFGIVLSMNGIYRGAIFEGLSVVKATNPDLWVVERHRGGPINEQSIMPEFFHYSVAALEGVEKASPYIIYSVDREIYGKSHRFTIIGYDVFGGLGGPQKLTAGRALQRAHYEMVAHEKLGFRLGEKIPLGLHTYTVVGLTREAISPDGEPLVFLSLPDAQEILFLRDSEEVRNQRQRLSRTLAAQGLAPWEGERLLPALQPDTHLINAILVKLTPGADRDRVARQITEWLYFSAYTTEQEVQLILKGRLSTMVGQLFLFRTLLLLIAVVIISLVIYTFTMEKIRPIAVMKLIGAPNRVIIRLVMEQSLLLTLSSFLLGLVLVHNTYHKFPRLVLLTPTDDLLTLALALVGGVLASILGIWRALKIPPALAIGGA